MGCGTQNLGSAMRSCGACPALPPTRRWKMVDRIGAARVALGTEVMVNLGGVPAQDSAGRFAHVRGIYFSANLRATTAGANVAYSAYSLRAMFSAMFLQDVSGHKFWSALDGRTILDDQFFRHNKQTNWPALKTGVQAGLPVSPGQAGSPTVSVDAGIPVNVGVATENYPISLYAPLATNNTGAIWVNPLQGLIPISALQREGADALKFTVAAALPGTSTGITLVGLYNLAGVAGLDVWLDLVYLPALVVDAPWQLETYTLTETSGVLKHPDRITEYAVIRHFPNDVNGSNSVGQAQAQDVDGITLTAAGFTEVGGITQADARLRGMLFYSSDPDSAVSRMNAAQDLPMLTAAGAALAIVLYPYRSRETAASGPISFEYATREGNWTRYLHRTVKCQNEQRARAIAKAGKCDPCSACYSTNVKGEAIVDGTMLAAAPMMVYP